MKSKLDYLKGSIWLMLSCGDVYVFSKCLNVCCGEDCSLIFKYRIVNYTSYGILSLNVSLF